MAGAWDGRWRAECLVEVPRQDPQNDSIERLQIAPERYACSGRSDGFELLAPDFAGEGLFVFQVFCPMGRLSMILASCRAVFCVPV